MVELSKLFIHIVLLLNASLAFTQDVWLHPNKGQWEERILFKVEMDDGAMFIEKDGFAYHLDNLTSVHNHLYEEHSSHDDEIIHFGLKSTFLNSHWQGEYVVSDSSNFYRNYILGADSTKWKSEVYSYKKVEFIDFYPNIDLIIKGTSAVKYSFRVKPGGDISQIKIRYEGQEQISLDKEGNLKVKTSLGVLKESAPYSFLAENRTEINSEFQLQGSVASFFIENISQINETFIIDPEITFSTFSGSSADNWGYTATPDVNANLFGGGIVRGTGYPITTGAFDATYNGGSGTYPWDVAISKFNAQGTSLIYSTYFGGNGNETPNSIIANDAGELYIFGVTSSSNLPMTPNAYQGSFMGGPTTDENRILLQGSDLYIARLSANGANLLSSTFLGGTGIDGVNIGSLAYNYGDQYRGEITLDDAGNVYFSSTTQSADFPTAGAAADNTLSGGQDAIIGKMNPNLSTLNWCTYFGGAGIETGNALQVSGNGNVYVTGGTTSTSLSVSSGLDLTYNGEIDGYLIELDANTANLLAGTYIGTSSYDQGYFVQVDLDNKPYVYGQTDGSMPISPSKYGNANSGQFIKKFNSTLTAEEWSTTIGASSGAPEISPTAFLVSDCYTIYIAGWGGNTNNSSVPSSSTNGFPVTNDAFQANTNGSNFYIAVLGSDAKTLDYATFMGGTNSSANHVDGGTSRFDKKGRIYHAVCGSCGTPTTGFTTTVGAFSNTDNSTNCNMACFKFDLSNIKSTVGAVDPLICLPNSVTFPNNSQNGNSFFWDFGDNNTSTDFSPTHLYGGPGNYTVTLVVGDSLNCFENDTTIFDIEIDIFEGGVVVPPTPICPGEPFQLEAFGGASYEWTPASLLNNANIATPIATITQPTTFTVIVSDVCGSDTLNAFLDLYGGNVESIGDTSICFGEEITVWASGGGTYEWSPPNGLQDTDQASTIASPDATTTYSILVTTPEGCELTKNFTIEVFYDAPNPILDDTLKLCRLSSEEITAGGAVSYAWSPPNGLNTTIGATVVTNITDDIEYFVDFTNPCGTVQDSIYVEIIEVYAEAGNDTIVCPREPANVWAEGGESFSWFPEELTINPFSAETVVQPNYPTNFGVEVTDIYGCKDTAYVFIDHYPEPSIKANRDYYGFVGDDIQLNATTNVPGNFTWSPTEFLSCVSCSSPISTPNESIDYIVYFVDENNCKAQDTTSIIFEGIVYVPNTFTPDDNEFNPKFKVKGGNIASFEMQIFNRWGKLIYEFTDFFDAWDGTYKGVKCKDGTYIWKMKYRDIEDNLVNKAGHINLLR